MYEYLHENTLGTRRAVFYIRLTAIRQDVVSNAPLWSRYSHIFLSPFRGLSMAVVTSGVVQMLHVYVVCCTINRLLVHYLQIVEPASPPCPTIAQSRSGFDADNKIRQSKQTSNDRERLYLSYCAIPPCFRSGQQGNRNKPAATASICVCTM